MRTLRVLLLGVLTACGMWAASNGDASATYDKTAAAAYLDGRESWWLTWPRSQRDHGTACVSCHTALPYALSRQTLRGSLGEKTASSVEQAMLANITKRVGLWSEVEPFYNEKSGPNKSVESRTTEAILNALILANYDKAMGQLSDPAKAALETMWAMQQPTGAWIWLNFHNSPWEGNESEYWGATLAQMAANLTPEGYRSNPKIQNNLKLLGGYLTEHYATQPLVNKTVLFWVSARAPELLNAERRAALKDNLYGLQKPDGGWSLSSLGDWKRHDDTPEETKSDGYATGLIVLALEENGVPASDAHLSKGLAWLRTNQDTAGGFWPAYSLNKQRDLTTDTGKLMVDAATAYAVMALERAEGRK